MLGLLNQKEKMVKFKLIESVIIFSAILPPEIGGPTTFIDWIIKNNPDKNFIVVGFSNKPLQKSKSNFIPIVIPFYSEFNFISPLLRQLHLLLISIILIKNSKRVVILDPVIIGLIPIIISKLFNKRSILRFVGDYPYESYLLKGRKPLTLKEFYMLNYHDPRIILQTVSLRLVSIITVPSNYLRNHLIDTYNLALDKIKLIYNARNPIVINEKGQQKNINQIIYAGRFVTWKGLHDLLGGFYYYNLKKKSSNLSFKLMIIGEGPLKFKISQLIKKLKLNDYVMIKDKMKREDLLKLISSCGILMLTSYYEGLPHIIIEAKEMKTYYIATDVGGTSEIHNNKLGMLIPPGDVNAIKESLLMMDKETILAPQEYNESDSIPEFELLRINEIWMNLIKC